MSARVLLLILALCWASSAEAAIRYLDSAVASSGNGQSWATAWKNFSNITGLQPGDTVWISGGTTSKTYNTGEFLSASGTAGNYITYQVSSEVGHNGTVNIVVPGGSPWHWIYSSQSQDIGQWVKFSGNTGDGVNRLNVDAPILWEGVNSQGMILEYITTTAKVLAYDTDTVELSHILFTLNNGIDGIIVGIGRNEGAITYPSGYTRNSIHHCTLNIAVFTGTGSGDDGMQNIGNVDVYSNVLQGVSVNPYNGTQHQDGIQTKGPNVRIRDNLFRDLVQYGILGEFFSNGGHFQIYNNVFYNMFNPNIAIGTSVSNLTITDFQIFNNTFVGAGTAISLGGGFPNTTTTNSFIVNNLIYDTDNPMINFNCSGCSGPSVTISNNSNGTTTGISFVNATSDWHLQSGSTTAIDQGISPSYITSVTTLDRDGNTRSGTWDLGAYEFSAGGSSRTHAVGGGLRGTGTLRMQ